MKIKHIYWFANFNLFSPSVRYRGKYALDYLENKFNIKNTFIFPSYHPKMVFKFIKTLLEILFFRKTDSIVVIENIYTKRIYASLLRLLVHLRPQYTLYDIDDAEYERFSPETIHFFMRKCAACSAGSVALRDYALQFNSRVFLLTSPIISHDIIKKERNSVLTIGWIGFFSAHRRSLFQAFFPALQQLPFSIKLVLLGVNKPEDRQAVLDYCANCPGVVLDMPETLDWQDEEAIYHKIAAFDWGIATLSDEPLYLAKSAFKMKQYLSCGVPVLAQPKGENRHFLEDGVNGFFCENADDFRVAIIRVATLNGDDYQCLSKQARQSYEQFRMDHYCQRLLHFYEKMEN